MDDDSHLLTLKLKTKEATHASFMPFIEGGAFFVKTMDPYVMGDEVLLSIDWMEAPEPIEVIGKVIWLTPEGAQGGKPQGVGVQVVEDTSGKLIKQIETLLAGTEENTDATQTL